jgi:hypothetical protein
MSPQDYEHPLSYTVWGFSIKKLKWNLSVEGYRFKTTNCTGRGCIDKNLSKYVLQTKF